MLLEFICYTTFIVTGWMCWDFFNVKRGGIEEVPKTNAQLVADLYKVVRNINDNPSLNPMPGKDLYVSLKSGVETCKIISKIKWRELNTFLFSPKRLPNSNLYSVPYYLGGNWYYALVKHKIGQNVVVSVEGLDLGSNQVDATEIVKKHLGPGEDFYGQSVTPSMLGYFRLRFFVTTRPEVITFMADEVIQGFT